MIAKFTNIRSYFDMLLYGQQTLNDVDVDDDGSGGDVLLPEDVVEQVTQVSDFDMAQNFNDEF
ncbi:MAG: hypothetical protein DRQ51_10590 [Gammaproteobacteria bacterium]|nr:MAG: hypothetical protein DRQ51_10590 [Gammaproteobacteria bacterium]